MANTPSRCLVDTCLDDIIMHDGNHLRHKQVQTCVTTPVAQDSPLRSNHLRHKQVQTCVTTPVAQDSPLRSASATTLRTTSTHTKSTCCQPMHKLVERWSSFGRVLGGTVSGWSSGKPRVFGGFDELVERMGGSLVECWSSFGRVLVACWSSVRGRLIVFLPQELLHGTVVQAPPLLRHAWPAAGRLTPTALADRRQPIADQTVQNFQRRDTWSKQFALPGHS